MAYVSEENTPVHRPHTSIGSYGSSQYSTSSPASSQHPPPVYRSKARTPATPEIPRLKLRKPESPSKYIQSEVRKVSTELSKVMEEAFNRSSICSSVRTAGTDRNDLGQYDTPPTSFSNRDSGGSSIITPNPKALLGQRPLPPIPTETPNTFLQRKLAETRAEIAQRFDQEGNNTDHFNEVLENLDRLLLPAATNKRVVSAPAKSPEHSAPLHVIPEEKSDTVDMLDQPYSPHYRAVTDPIRPQGRHAGMAAEHHTIRLVDQSPTRVAPLNIRKRSGVSVASKAVDEAAPAIRQGPETNITVRSYQDVKEDLLAARTNESAPVVENKEATVKKKKSLWFRRNTEEKEHDQESKENHEKKNPALGLLQIPETWQGFEDRLKTASPAPLSAVSAHDTKTSDDSEFPMRSSSAPAAKGDDARRKGLFGFFGKKTKDDKIRKPLELGGKNIRDPIFALQYIDLVCTVNHSSSSILSGFDLGPENGSDAAPRTGPPEMQMNWLSRFLHIKPASKTLCFQIGRGKARQDLVRLLRDWQRFGVRDVTFDRETNVINARIDKNNRKYTSQTFSNFIFSEWRVQDWRIEVEVLDVDMILRCNSAFLSRPFDGPSANISVLQISRSSQCLLSLSFMLFSSMAAVPIYAWPASLKLVEQLPASAKLLILSRMFAEPATCLSKTRSKRPR